MRPEERERRQKRAASTAVAVATTLALVKVVTGLYVNSVAVLASAADSLLDVFASTMNLVAIRIAHAPPDDDHRFGHAKAEALATAGQALLIGGSAAYLLLEGSRRILSPEPLRQPSVGLLVMAIAAITSGVLVAYMRRVAKTTDSSALRADATHYQTDVLTNVAVLGGVAVSWVWHIAWLDGLLTVAVALYVGGAAISLLRGATRVLMDAEIPEADRERIISIVRSFEGRIQSYHGLRTRSAGRGFFVELHLEMDGDTPLQAAHDLGLEVEYAIRRALPTAQVMIHLDVEHDEEGYGGHPEASPRS